MTSYREALKIVLEHVNTLEMEEKPLPECIGQVLAEDIYSDYSLPLTDTSGPDGYAVRSADIKGAGKNTPAILEIIEIVRAGVMPKNKVTAGTAIRIMTGSIVPEGADCVVRFEDTDEPANKSGPNINNPTKVKIFVDQKPGINLNQAGKNIKKGALLLTKGSTIGPTQYSVLTTIGKNRIKVHRRPVIAVISTGDELIEPGQPLTSGKAYDCNAGTVRALICHYGGITKICGIARDTKESLLTTIRKGLKADAIITSGGVSKGDYDLVRLILEKAGKVFLARINMGPGASFAFGEYHMQSNGKTRTVPVFGLSGPPAGCMINFETMVRPALLKMRGCTNTDHPLIEAIAEDAMSEKKQMEFVCWTDLKLVNGQYRVRFNMTSEKGPLFSLAKANSLTGIPVGREVKAGDKVRVMPLDW